MKFRVLSVLLSLALVFSLSAPAFAIVSTDIQNQMLRILASVEEEKEYYGLSNLNFSAVQLGDEIPTYRVSDGALVPSDVRIIPITDGTDFLSFFYVANDADGSPFVQLSDELVSPLQNFVHGNPFSIIYDADGAHVYVDGSVHLLVLKEHPVSERGEDDLISFINRDSFADLTAKSCTTPSITLNVSSYIEKTSIPTAKSTASKYPAVDKISQLFLVFSVRYLCTANTIDSRLAASLSKPYQ